MSVVLVCLPNAPQVSEEAVKRDAEVDKYLESRVEGEKRKSSVDRHTIPILSIVVWEHSYICPRA